MEEVLKNLGGRKFLQSMLFIGIVLANYWAFNGIIPESMLMTIAAVIGVYDLANAIKGYASK